MTGTREEFERRRLHRARIEIWGDDVERCWPAQRDYAECGKSGHPEEYDWDEAEAFAMDLLQKNGDPTDPKNKKKGWRSGGDIEDAVIVHLERKLGKDKGPSKSTVRRRVPGWLKTFRKAEVAHNARNLIVRNSAQ